MIDLVARPVAGVGVFLVLASLGLGACGGSDSTAPTAVQATGARPPAPAVTGIECPKQIRISERSRCKLIRNRTKLKDCPDTRIGHDLGISGIPCSEAYGLMGPLGSAGLSALGDYSKSRLVVYRPAVATYQRRFEVRPTRWTCSAAWETHTVSGVQFICWRGADTIGFQFSG
jgi:hypothetical protein